MQPVNIAEFEPLARERLPADTFDYVSGGAGDEVTLRENRAAFQRIKLRPRTLVDVAKVSTSTKVLGHGLTMPVLLAPAAFQRMVHPDAEIATVRAAARAGVVMIASTFTSASMEEIAEAGGTRWFQLYCSRDRGLTQSLIQRAKEAGYTALCITVDVPRVGRREKDIRNHAAVPGEAMPRNFKDRLNLSAVPHAQQGSAIEKFVSDYLVESLTWRDIDWICSITDLPVLIKGILTDEDARLAPDYGAAGVVVSNHGGRQLDGAPATIDVLEEVVEAVAGRAEVLLDSGVRRGTDVVKALALGARGVLIGRPYLWGLAADGEAGVATVLDLLKAELELALALLGCTSVREVTKERVRR